MNDFRKHLEELMSDPAFREEWKAVEPEYQAARALISARLEENVTQAELAKRCGIRQANISRIENMETSPTVATLGKLAAGLGKNLVIEFR